MKKTFFWLAIVSLFFAACDSSKTLVHSDREHIERQWMLKKMEGFSTDELVKANAYINLTDLKNTNCKTGCNTLGFKTEIKSGNRIRFSDITSTYMSCAPFMKMEQSFSKFLEQVYSYEVKGHFIKFKSNSGDILIEAIAADWD